jgi:protein-disulfide isomerase
MKSPFRIILFLTFILLAFFLYRELKNKSEIEKSNNFYNNSQSENAEKNEIDQDLNHKNISENQEKIFDKNITSLKENDIFIGNKDAKIMMIEYDSLTCPHCKDFHDTIFNPIKKKYIDSGKILYISRSFPTDGMSFRLSLAVMCGKDNEEKLKLRKLIFDNQAMIYKNFEGVNFEDKSQKNIDDMKSKADKVLENFVNIFEMTGFEREKIKMCMDPEKSIEARDLLLSQSGDAFKSAYKINSAPTFLINGKIYYGAQTLKFWEEIIDKELQESENLS